MSLFRRLKYAFVAFFAALFSKPKVLESRQFYTRDGHKIAPDNISGLTIEELAHSLSRINRMCGHTSGPLGYSVARHSVFASKHVENKDLALKVLMFDSYKSLTGDISSPAKYILSEMGMGTTLISFEKMARDSIFNHFDIEPISYSDMTEILPVLVKAHASEVRDMVGVNLEAPFDEQVSPMDPRDAAAEFVDRYNELRGIEVPKKNILS